MFIRKRAARDPPSNQLFSDSMFPSVVEEGRHVLDDDIIPLQLRVQRHKERSLKISCSLQSFLFLFLANEQFC